MPSASRSIIQVPASAPLSGSAPAFSGFILVPSSQQTFQSVQSSVQTHKCPLKTVEQSAVILAGLVRLWLVNQRESARQKLDRWSSCCRRSSTNLQQWSDFLEVLGLGPELPSTPSNLSLSETLKAWKTRPLWWCSSGFSPGLSVTSLLSPGVNQSHRNELIHVDFGPGRRPSSGAAVVTGAKGRLIESIWAGCCRWSDSRLLYLIWTGWRCCGAVAYLLTPGVGASVSGVVTLFHGPAPLLYTSVLVKPLKWRQYWL